MENIWVFKTIVQFNNLKPGSLLLKSTECGEDGQEWFDMTTEMKTGNTVSHYAIPDESMVPATAEETAQVTMFLKKIYRVI